MILNELVKGQYLPYARATITSRAIPSIDGQKPVTRRILYVMHGHKLYEEDKDQVKSATITGETMRYHPNGDSSIYGAMVTQASGREGMNVPFIQSKGNFGKIYSTTAYAAARYTEVKLTPIAKYLFDSMNEDSVDMVPNYDNSLKEPAVLPVMFPNILCNPSDGIAVSTSSDIPPFNLVKVCNATKGILDGTITTVEQLAPVIGIPDFTTGGYMHISDENLIKLLRTGKGSVTMSSSLQLYSNKIVVDQLPYNVKLEEVKESIVKLIKDKVLQGISDVRDEMDIKGLKLTITIKNGYDSRRVALDLLRNTDLRKKLSFRIRVIIDGRCRELGVLELLNEWIKFRKNTLDRIYTYRLTEQTKKEALMSLWEKIKDHLKEVVRIITDNTQEVAANTLKDRYDLTDEQVVYILDLKLRQITADRAKKAIEDLAKLREEIEHNKLVISSDAEKAKIIKADLDEISEKFGKESKTQQRAEINEEAEKDVSRHVANDDIVAVVLTNTGYIKRLEGNAMYVDQYESRYGDVETQRWMLRNNEYMLVFDRFGVAHKILVDTIDSSRGKPSDKVTDLVGLEKFEDIIYMDKSGDFTGGFNIITCHGVAYTIKYSKIAGKRSKYRSLYDELTPGTFFVTKVDKFFLFSNKDRAAYGDISGARNFDKKTWKISRCNAGEVFYRLLPLDKVFRLNLIDINKYGKGYPVKVKDDIVFFFEEEYNKQQEELQQYMNAGKTTENDENTESDEGTEQVSAGTNE